MSLQDISRKKLLLIGPIGSGKSSTGNFLLEDEHFLTGNRLTRVTREAKIRKHENGLMIGDLPGFDDINDDVFLKSFLEASNQLIAGLPFDALILIIMFDRDKGRAFDGVDGCARQLTRLFGTLASQSLVILCIQGDPYTRYSNDEFGIIMRNSDGYRYLVERNKGREIPFCLWDNTRPYNRQITNLIMCLENRRQITSVDLSYMFDMMRNELEKTRPINNTSNNNIN